MRWCGSCPHAPDLVVATPARATAPIARPIVPASQRTSLVTASARDARLLFSPPLMAPCAGLPATLTSWRVFRLKLFFLSGPPRVLRDAAQISDALLTLGSSSCALPLNAGSRYI